MIVRTRQLALSVLTTFVLLAATGCGTGRVPLTGEVKFDGTPIDDGTITFVAEGADAAKYGAHVEDGKYKFDKETGPMPGKYKVEVTWLKKTGRKVSTGDGEVRDEKANALPAKFNVQTTLTAEVKSGSTKMDFPLTSSQ
jgi:hypothetical protein